jgi:hypothetical protein
MLGLHTAQAQTSPPPTRADADSPSAQVERAGTLKIVNGTVVAIGTQGERALKPGDPLMASERLRTGADSSASLILRDGTTLMLGPSSQIDLREFAFNQTTYQGSLLMSVLKGSMRMITGWVGKTQPEAVKITTPTSTIGVLGTDFIVEVTEEQP